MGISASETNLGLKKIAEEKYGQTATGSQRFEDISLKGLSVDGTTDFKFYNGDITLTEDISGTPDGTAPYGAQEFRGYTQIQYTFNMRGSNTSEPGINKDIRATSTTYSSTPNQIARTDVFYYVYYRTNGNLAITAVSAVTANQTGGLSTYRKWVTQGGTVNTLTGTAQMSEPGIEISGVASGYTVRFEVDKNEGSQSENSGSILASVLPSSLGSMSLSGDTYTHSGTAAVPTQTSAQNTAGTYPTSTRVKADVDAQTITDSGPFNNPNAIADYSPAFRFIFEKSGEPTITIYCKAKMYAVATNAV